MREILGRRRTTRWALRSAALTCATRRQWPVVPGVTAELRRPLAQFARPLLRRRAPVRVPSSWEADPPACGCREPECEVPGAHPLDPPLLAATTDARMVRWWWTNRPTAPVLLATGGRAPCALSLPAGAGDWALAEIDRRKVPTGPVIAGPTRYAFLVRPYDLEELGELLYAQDWVPSSLRFHGEGGYVVLPPSETGAGRVRWERKPVDGGPAEWLPEMRSLLDVLLEASAAAPDSGSRLAY